MANVSGIVKSARKIMRQDTGTGSDELRILQLGWMLFLKIFSDKDKELELMDDNYISPIPAELILPSIGGHRSKRSFGPRRPPG